MNVILSKLNTAPLVFSSFSSHQRAFGYFNEYAQRALLGTKIPDFLVLSKLADQTLELIGDRTFLPSVKETEQMQKKIRADIKQKNYKALLKNFGGKLINLIQFIKERTQALDDNERWSGIIADMEPEADIDIENLVDSEKIPPWFIYVTVCLISRKQEQMFSLGRRMLLSD